MHGMLLIAYQRLSKFLPASVSGKLDWRWFPERADRFGGPFNGQTGRAAIFKEILKSIPFQAIVETGTYLGTTTLFLQETAGLPVYTVEAVPRSFHYARARLKSHQGVYSSLGDSRAFLTRLGTSAEVSHDRVFFYLDAHWHEDLPLAEELEIIAGYWSDPVIMIDDFQVADDSGYSFDDYGAGKRLTLEYLPKAISAGFQVFWPALSGERETGLRRGCIVAGRRIQAAKVLENLAVLRDAGIRSEPGAA